MKKYLIFMMISIISVAADQATKKAVNRNIGLHENIVVVEGFFNLTHVRNTGAAFGILQGASPKFKFPFFTAVSVAAILVIGFLFVKTPPEDTLMVYSLSLVMSGAAGNFIDRALYGYVVDFIEVYFRDYHWPSFNVADIAISIGAGLMIIEMFRAGRAQPPAQEVPPPSGTTEQPPPVAGA